jgi:hypothetical protein
MIGPQILALLRGREKPALLPEIAVGIGRSEAFTQIVCGLLADTRQIKYVPASASGGTWGYIIPPAA